MTMTLLYRVAALVAMVQSMETDVSVFRCDHIPQCKNHYEQYSCSLREETDKCTASQAALPERTPKGTCVRMCHLNTKCHSYVWSPKDSICRQCSSNQIPVNLTWVSKFPIHKLAKNLNKHSTRKLGYGVHSGYLRSMSIQSIDYVEKGYIDPKPSRFSIYSALIPASAESIVWSFEGHFCVLTPLLKRLDERQARTSNFLDFFLNG